MTTERRQFTDAVVKLIAKTRDGAIKWRIESSPAAGMDPHRRIIENQYKCQYLGQNMRLTRMGPPGSSITRVFSGSTRVPEEQSTVALELLDNLGRSVWTFPDSAALRDLYEAVQYQVTGVQDFIDRLLNE